MSQRTILLTGATGRIGRVLTRHFLKAGDRVVATSRSRESAAVLEAEFAEHSEKGSLRLKIVDLDEPEACAALAGAVAAMGPAALINNARNLVNLAVGSDGNVGRAEFEGELRLGVIVPYELTVALLDAGAPLGAVVNIGSIYGVTAFNTALYDDPGRQAPLQYGVAKAALLHLTKELAVRLAPRNVRVNAVSYGGVEGRAPQEFRARYGRLCPQGRMLDDDDIAGPVEFLISSGARAVTGHNLIADGGWTLW